MTYQTRGAEKGETGVLPRLNPAARADRVARPGPEGMGRGAAPDVEAAVSDAGLLNGGQVAGEPEPGASGSARPGSAATVAENAPQKFDLYEQDVFQALKEASNDLEGWKENLESESPPIREAAERTLPRMEAKLAALSKEPSEILKLLMAVQGRVIELAGSGSDEDAVAKQVVEEFPDLLDYAGLLGMTEWGDHLHQDIMFLCASSKADCKNDPAGDTAGEEPGTRESKNLHDPANSAEPTADDPPVLLIDLKGTLTNIEGNRLNEETLGLLREYKDRGAKVILWTNETAAETDEVMRTTGIPPDLFDQVITFDDKPSFDTFRARLAAQGFTDRQIEEMGDSYGHGTGWPGSGKFPQFFGSRAALVDDTPRFKQESGQILGTEKEAVPVFGPYDSELRAELDRFLGLTDPQSVSPPGFAEPKGGYSEAARDPLRHLTQAERWAYDYLKNNAGRAVPPEALVTALGQELYGRTGDVSQYYADAGNYARQLVHQITAKLPSGMAERISRVSGRGYMYSDETHPPLDPTYKMTGYQSRLFNSLATHEGQIVDPGRLIRGIWGTEIPLDYGDHSLRELVRELRKELPQGYRIDTVKSGPVIGYRLVREEESAEPEDDQ